MSWNDYADKCAELVDNMLITSDYFGLRELGFALRTLHRDIVLYFLLKRQDGYPIQRLWE